MNVPPELDAITDKVMAYNPDVPKEPLKVIAGAPDSPLVIGDIEIPCFVLEDETRVLVQRGMAIAMGMSKPSGAQIGRFALSKTINPFVSNDLIEVLNNPLKFWTPKGIGHGYPATLLVELCRAVLEARDAGALRTSQLHIAARCDTLIRGLASVGIIALVDEATGYQRVREERALATILERWITKEHERWTQTFPYEFYEEIFRLKGWPGPQGTKRPALIGRYTNEIVYQRLAPGVLEELQRKNPTLPRPSGGRRHKHHQWFTPDFGHPKLKGHLEGVMALMRISSSWHVFLKNLDIAYPKQNLNREFPFGDGSEQ